MDTQLLKICSQDYQLHCSLTARFVIHAGIDGGPPYIDRYGTQATQFHIPICWTHDCWRQRWCRMVSVLSVLPTWVWMHLCQRHQPPSRTSVSVTPYYIVSYRSLSLHWKQKERYQVWRCSMGKMSEIWYGKDCCRDILFLNQWLTGLYIHTIT